MTSERTELRRYIMNYHKTHNKVETDDLEFNDDDFFNIDGAIEINMTVALQEYTNICDVAGINNIMDKVYKVATEREQNMVICLVRGMDFERIGEIFGIKKKTVVSIINKVLDKVIEDSH